MVSLSLHVLPHLEVKGGQRLIQEKDLRLVHDGPSDRDPLLLSSGKGIHITVLIVAHAHKLEYFPDPDVDLVFGDAFKFESEGDVVINIKVGEQGVSLEHCVQRPLVRRDTGYIPELGLAATVVPFHHDLALVGLEESCYHPQQGCLSAARGTKQGHELAFTDI